MLMEVCDSSALCNHKAVVHKNDGNTIVDSFLNEPVLGKGSYSTVYLVRDNAMQEPSLRPPTLNLYFFYCCYFQIPAPSLT